MVVVSLALVGAGVGLVLLAARQTAKRSED
jgi:hypothetical protein